MLVYQQKRIGDFLATFRAKVVKEGRSFYAHSGKRGAVVVQLKNCPENDRYHEGGFYYVPLDKIPASMDRIADGGLTLTQYLTKYDPKKQAVAVLWYKNDCEIVRVDG